MLRNSLLRNNLSVWIVRAQTQLRPCSTLTSGEGKSSDDSSSNPSKEINLPGRYYQDLLFRGRQRRLLAVGDLRKLMQLCVRPSHVRYAVEGVKLFQTKGHDFSEEVNSHFITACIRGGNPQAAAELMCIPKHRIGAWSTLTSIGRLIDALDEEKDAELLKNLLFVLAPKGVKFSESAVIKCLDAAVKTEAFVADEALSHMVLKAVHPLNSSLLASKLEEISRAVNSKSGSGVDASSSTSDDGNKKIGMAE